MFSIGGYETCLIHISEYLELMQVAATPTKEQMALKAAVHMPKISYVCVAVYTIRVLSAITPPLPTSMYNSNIEKSCFFPLARSRNEH